MIKQAPPPEPESETKRVIVPMPADLVAWIDDYRYANRVPSQSEAVRQLLRHALQELAPKRGGPKK